MVLSRTVRVAAGIHRRRLFAGGTRAPVGRRQPLIFEDMFVLLF